MSKIHTVLVNLKFEHLNQDQGIEIIRFVEERTADYLHIAFDCRIVQGLIIGSNEPNKILEVLEQCRDAYQQQINDYLKSLNETLGDNLSEIVSTLYSKRDYSCSSDLNNLADFLNGKYTFEFGFFDTQWSTSRIDENTLQKIRKAPEDYALVLFDCHHEGGYLTKYYYNSVVKPSRSDFLICHNDTLTPNQVKLLERFVEEFIPNNSIDVMEYRKRQAVDIVQSKLSNGRPILKEKSLREIFESKYNLRKCEAVVDKYNFFLKRLQNGESITKVRIDLNSTIPISLFRAFCKILNEDEEFDFIEEKERF